MLAAWHTRVVTTLVVSPHLDDATLSIGGSIAAWVAAGERVVVASVYTVGPPLDDVSPAMRKFADYAARTREDEAACQTLGAELRWLGQTERAFRKPYLSGWSFFTTPGSRGGFSTLPSVIRALEPLADLDPRLIYVPLGIGNHVDHVETLIAVTDWALARGWGERLRFYEDFYALSGTMRRRHFVARQRIWPRWRSPMLQARRLALILNAIAAARRGPEVENYLSPALRDAHWTVEPHDIGAFEDTKLAAIACYTSQTRAFGGYAGIARATRTFHAVCGGEPLWRAA